MTIAGINQPTSKLRTRIGVIAAAVVMAAGLSITGAAPASAATSCSSLGTDWNRIVGSCTSTTSSFTIKWTCWGSSTVKSTTFRVGAPPLNGLSFNFKACDLVGVSGVWKA